MGDGLGGETLLELIRLASEKRLLDDCRVDGGEILIQVGSVNIGLRDEQSAKAFIRGLLRGYEKARQFDAEGGDNT